MEEKFVYLMHASLEICRLSQQRLKEAGIESKLEDYSQNAFFRVYGASAFLGKKITVPESKLAQAKELLNITEDKQNISKIPKGDNLVRKIFRLVSIIFLIIFLIMYILGFISNLKAF